MPKQSVYIETTVVSYLTARPSRDLIVAAHQQVTEEWWENTLSLLDPFVSPIVIEEVSRGDEASAKLRLEKIVRFSVLEITNEVRDLAELYFKRIPIPDKARGDAFHLAYASFYKIDYLLTWNCNHLANVNKKEHIEAINRKLKLFVPEIITPIQLFKETGDENER